MFWQLRVFELSIHAFGMLVGRKSMYNNHHLTYNMIDPVVGEKRALLFRSSCIWAKRSEHGGHFPIYGSILSLGVTLTPTLAERPKATRDVWGGDVMVCVASPYLG